MDWKYKALVQQIISHLPNSGWLNYLGQRYITKKLPVDKGEFLKRVGIAQGHFRKYLKYKETASSIDHAIFYEFGAGWDMIVTLSYYFFGVNSQILIDIRPLIRIELINNTLEKFKDCQAELKSQLDIEIKRPINFISSKNNISQLKEHYGINYNAPCDARHTSLCSNSVDFLSSTYTLEHIPKDDILSIFEECYRILKKGGIMSCEIDYKDHFSFFDNNISVYNFLRYSDSIWQIFNPPILYQNRLRHKDYIDVVKNTKFQIIEETYDKPTEEDIATLEGTNAYSSFKNNYSLTELAIQEGRLVLKK